jgi:hypothetical protein
MPKKYLCKEIFLYLVLRVRVMWHFLGDVWVMPCFYRGKLPEKPWGMGYGVVQIPCKLTGKSKYL